ncbi:DoxX family membrane protein [Yinghuangia soli]|uniref:DoxX family membrane protein n=1 Tax=Yinghuangia soli TaxID=2908204 RepID=A0AA41Q3Q5_9ACTN|nr:DoxX family membrane protein [Yinghuangia soli]MCF2529527.1 DoxX family membrane protein [Yinghuangia soli]
MAATAQRTEAVADITWEAAGVAPRNAPTAAPDPSHATTPFARRALAALRILLGWMFLWPFLDKLFGLGFSTESAKAVVNGGSPTEGFLKFGTQGPFAHMFDSVAGAWWLDAVFMLGLLGIGVALIAGIGLRIAAVSCTLMMLFMYLVTLQPATNPIVDSHWLMAIAAIVAAATYAGNTWGLGRRWGSTALVRRYAWLR